MTQAPETPEPALAIRLRSAAAELVAERGPAGFSLREVARRAGVSHAAPGHHYGSTQGLLTAVAADGFTTLADALRKASDGHDDPRDQLRAGGKAYVDVALSNPGHYALMFSNDMIDQDDERLATVGPASFAELVACVQRIADQFNPDLDVETASMMAWSTMAGLVEIAGKFDHLADSGEVQRRELTDTVDRMTDLLIVAFVES